MLTARHLQHWVDRADFVLRRDGNVLWVAVTPGDWRLVVDGVRYLRRKYPALRRRLMFTPLAKTD